MHESSRHRSRSSNQRSRQPVTAGTFHLATGATSPQVVATLLPPTGGAGFGVLGLHLEGDDLLPAVNTFANPDLNGVWRVDTEAGATAHVPGSEAIVVPNDLTTWDGDIYVTDSFLGAVWIITADGRVEPWLQSDLLARLGVLIPGLPIGANGIDAFGGKLYIANSEKSVIVEARINGHGPGAEPTVLATVNRVPDGVEVDHRGRPHTVLLDQAQRQPTSRRVNIAMPPAKVASEIAVSTTIAVDP